MCSHSSSKPKVITTSVPAPAVAAAAPQSTNVTGMDTVKESAGAVKAKGKRRLTIPVASSGTGINV